MGKCDALQTGDSVIRALFANIKSDHLNAVSFVLDAETQEQAMIDQSRITLEAGKRGGKPCIRGLRITVYDVLEWLAQGMSETEILADYPELEPDDIRAVLAFAAKGRRVQ